jgi:hypothetical protein
MDAKELKKAEKETLVVKNKIIRKLKKEFFIYYNILNLTEYVEAYKDIKHNHNGVAKDVCLKFKETGKFVCIEKGSPAKIEYWVEKAVKKDWKDRYWWAVLILGAIIGFGLDIARVELTKKIEQPASQSQQAIPALTDTSASHKIH